MKTLQLDINDAIYFAGAEKYASLRPAAERAVAKINDGTGAGSDFLGWVKLPSSITAEELNDIKAAAADLRKDNDYVVSIGIGGSFDKAAYLAKRALLRTVGEHNADPLYADMEQRILDKVNASGVGPQGLGGTVTALSCAIEPFGTHIAGLPCVVNISCHVTRHAEGEI